MVKQVHPSVFVIGSTRMSHHPMTDENGLAEYLHEVGVESWMPEGDISDLEALTEVYSRSCYKSFEVGLNPNITRVRGSNQEHLANIIKVNHGSVMEHTSVNFMFCNVSIVFTGELNRHRVGTAISQESLRFVRLDNIGQWIPPCFQDIPGSASVMEYAFREAERAYAQLLALAARKEGVETFDEIKDFNTKKVYTSAARRVAPMGLATNHGWTCNIRELRHVLALRTNPSAEEEMRYVFGEVGNIVANKFPNLFQDFEPQPDGPFVIWKKS